MIVAVSAQAGGNLAPKFDYSEDPRGDAGYYDTTGRNRHECVRPAGTQKHLYEFSAGQSNEASYGGDLYIPRHSGRIDNLNIADGGCYPITGPLLGPGWNTNGPGGAIPVHRADLLVDGGFDRVTLVPVALSNTSMAWWADRLYDRVCAGVAWLRLRSVTPDTPGAFFSLHVALGETDAISGVVTQDAWENDFKRFVARVRRCGFRGRVFVRIETSINGIPSPAIQDAQRGVVDNIDIFQSGNADSIPHDGRPQDWIHLVDLAGRSNGASRMAARDALAMHASGPPF